MGETTGNDLLRCGIMHTVKKKRIMVREQVLTCFSGFINAYKRKEWGKKTGNDLLRYGFMLKNEKNDGTKTGFDLLFGVVSYIQKETMKAR
jgi:hypothetical protein